MGGRCRLPLAIWVACLTALWMWPFAALQADEPNDSASLESPADSTTGLGESYCDADDDDDKDDADDDGNEDQISHLREAAEHLREAGRPELAARLEGEADRMATVSSDRPEPRRPQREANRPQSDLQRAIGSLHAEVRRQRREIEELRGRLDRIVQHLRSGPPDEGRGIRRDDDRPPRQGESRRGPPPREDGPPPR